MNRTKAKRRVLGLPLAAVALSALSHAAQPPHIEWERTFGGAGYERGNCVQQTSDGGYILAGYTTSYGVDDAYLIKTDRNGIRQWEKTYGAIGGEDALSIGQTPDGGYIVAGRTFSDDSSFLMKTDSGGNAQWVKSLSGALDPRLHCVQQTTDGGFVVVGSTGGSTSTDVYFVKTDANGNKQWERTFGGPGNDWGHSVQQTFDGGCVIIGRRQLVAGEPDTDIYLIKTDANGNLQWEKLYGGPEWDEGRSVVQALDGGFAITGVNGIGRVGDNTLVGGVLLMNTDSHGNLLWERSFVVSPAASGHDLARTLDRGYVVVGYTNAFSTNGGHGYVVKTNGSGDMEWENLLHEASAPRSIQQTADGGYVISGTRSYTGTPSDLFLLKLAPDGPPPLSARSSWRLYE